MSMMSNERKVDIGWTLVSEGGPSLDGLIGVLHC